jgi:hypothetical protein
LYRPIDDAIGNEIPYAGAFQPFINSIERIDKYQDTDGKNIDCLIVNLKREPVLEHALGDQRAAPCPM